MAIPHVTDHEHQVDAVGTEGVGHLAVILVTAFALGANDLVGNAW